MERKKCGHSKTFFYFLKNIKGLVFFIYKINPLVIVSRHTNCNFMSSYCQNNLIIHVYWNVRNIQEIVVIQNFLFFNLKKTFYVLGLIINLLSNGALDLVIPVLINISLCIFTMCACMLCFSEKRLGHTMHLIFIFWCTFLK